MSRITLDQTWSILLGKTLGDTNYWAEQNKIPLGSLNPPETYEDTIPEEDIVIIDFDPITKPTTERKAMNTLILAGSGDGKSLLAKLLWSVFQDSGYYCIYVDPKSTDSGRARKSWKNSRLPPYMIPKGITLQHFMPSWAITKDYAHMEHNFRKYSTRLRKINEKEMWQGLGMTSIGAFQTTRIIQEYISKKGDINLKQLQNAIFNLEREELPPGSSDAVIRVLTNLEYFGIVDDKIPELNIWDEWKRGNSICLSYNSGSETFMSFDIGHKIKESARLYFKGNKNPIMWFLDDSSFYSGVIPFSRFNFAVQEIKNIGFNYRSLGVYNTMMVQSLKIIDENVAETYRTKIISPYFSNPDSLSEINVPKKAIDYIKKGKLFRDKKNHLLQYLLIDEDNNVIPFFPFTPPCNHFSPVYFEKRPEEQKEAVKV